MRARVIQGIAAEPLKAGEAVVLVSDGGLVFVADGRPALDLGADEYREVGKAMPALTNASKSATS